MKERPPEVDQENFQDATAILREGGVFFWLDQGSLLGAVREGGPIPWDPDIDLSIWSQDFPLLRKLRPRFEASGFYFEAHEYKDCVFLARSGGRTIEIASQTIEGAYVVRHNAEPRNRRWERGVKALLGKLPERLFFRIRHLGRKWFPRPEVVFRSPAHFFSDFRRTEFLGCADVSIPVDAEDYLEFKYGPEWRRPRKEWDYSSDDGAARVRTPPRGGTDAREDAS